MPDSERSTDDAARTCTVTPRGRFVKRAFLFEGIARIGRDVYDNVQTMIAGRRTRAPGKQRTAGMMWILRGLLRCGGCGRLMSTHTVRSGPVIHGYYRCRSTAGGREVCKGVMISAYEIDTAVLSEIGAGPKLTSKEHQAAVRAAVRAAVYDAPSGNVKTELVGPPRGMIAS